MSRTNFTPHYSSFFLLSVMHILGMSLHRYSGRVPALELYWKLISCCIYFCFFIFCLLRHRDTISLSSFTGFDWDRGNLLHRSAYTTSCVKWLSSPSHAAMKASRVECMRVWEGTEEGQLTLTDQRDIPCHTVSCSSIQAMRNKEEEHSVMAFFSSHCSAWWSLAFLEIDELLLAHPKWWKNSLFWFPFYVHLFLYLLKSLYLISWNFIFKFLISPQCTVGSDLVVAWGWSAARGRTTATHRNFIF